MSTRAQRQAEALATVELDEFHPDNRVAAAFADLRANDSALRYLETELRRANDALKREPSSVPARQRRDLVKAELAAAADVRKTITELIEGLDSA